MDRNYRAIAPMSEIGNHNPWRQWNVGQEKRVVQVHRGQIELQKFRQVLRQAAHFDVRAHMRNDATLAFDAGRRGLALEMNRQPQPDLLVLHDALQIDVHYGMARRMHLHILDDGFLRFAIDVDAYDRRVELLAVNHRQQILLIEHEGLRA
jgi:hypothetical protein